MVIEAIVFDLDGVIVDSERPVFDAWSRAFTRHGGAIDLEEWNRCIGTSNGGVRAYELVERKRGGGLPPFEEMRAEVRVEVTGIAHTMRAMPGVAEWVEEAATLGLGLAVASSSPAQWVQDCLRAAGLESYFPWRATPDGGFRAKPEPDLYLASLERLGVGADRALAIEDSHNGVRAARSAGLWCLAVPNTITLDADLSAAHHRLSSLAELRLSEFLERFAS